jgi:hypothetical protein
MYEVDVYISESYLVFELNGVVIYDFPTEFFSSYQDQLLDKQWYTTEVETKARELCNE